ncbi:peptidyl-prolyl cis-trans isomerase [Lutibacter sp.]|uniref:peptidyl-prolyl cis-trans isomerase n=1 Tax=Lutibacter sp. TaxID=1925666 RepID=UPI001A1E2B54|nr:peptidyl-prolyl cis-trans isomerase [Lutibacter sp.]MBI9041347.1 peptidyl-prolyl cis-trans isomerase [Lutibacter sp.]
MKNLIPYLILLISLQSCNYFTFKDTEKEAVARVNDTYLYKEDLTNIFNTGLSKQDSTLLVNSYINNWVKQQLLLAKAQINLEDTQSDFDDLVKKYREDLYINSYKEAVVKQYLNYDITPQDIDKFYNENGQNFKLNEELVKLKYIKIGKDLINKNEIIRLFESSKKKDLDTLQHREIFLKSQHLNDSIWVKLSELYIKVPILKDLDKQELLKKDNFVKKEDSLSLYLVKIKNVLNRNEIAPKSYITPSIKQMILHQRKLQLLKNIEETLLEDAQNKKQFEIY